MPKTSIENPSVVLKHLGISDVSPSAFSGTHAIRVNRGKAVNITSPVDGSVLGAVNLAGEKEYRFVVREAIEAQRKWALVPAPKRGEIIRQIGLAFRKEKESLGKLVSWESGKILQEGLGEIQEVIDICDFAVGLSRQLYGLTMHSERPEHRMYEQWHPLGVVGVISAFNFPAAVWAWNAMLASVCGNAVVWKPSEKTPLTAVACHKIIAGVLQRNELPDGLFTLVLGGRDVGEWMAEDHQVALVSATGSTRMGRAVASAVAARLGKSLLELGGNNAIILTPNAPLDLAIPAIVFGAVGTCGQRCTSTRRVIVHASILPRVVNALKKAYEKLQIGHPLQNGTLVGPLIDRGAKLNFFKALDQIKREGGQLLCGGQDITVRGLGGGNYVSPAIVRVKGNTPMVMEETFAPILYVMPYEHDLDEAIALQNEVSQGLSSAIFTLNMREAEYFLSAKGSDCGIANVNIGTSGAEIGGAFGGEKETGGGRESGSDAWRAYMRRQTNTINFSSALPLAQGIRFDI